MEQIQDDSLRLQICEKCYEHQNYDMHSEKQYQQAYQKVIKCSQQIGITIVRNLPPKYLTKIADSRTSTKRYIDSNTSKIIQFPSKGSFEVYYKQIFIYSKIQTSIFPNIQYLSLIIKVLKELCYSNQGILTRLDQFRCLQYEWKKTCNIFQTLYNYVKLNACGNQSQACIRQILQSIGEKKIEGGKKRKVIHPYIIFENREKMFKMESIYCPKTAFSQFVSKQTGKQGKKWAKTRTHRPQTGCIQRKQALEGKENSCTQRSIALRGNGNNRKHIFQMVIKEENKNLDESKIRKWMKRQNLQIEEQKKWRSESRKDHINFQRKYNKSVQLKSRKKRNQIFLSFMSKGKTSTPSNNIAKKINRKNLQPRDLKNEFLMKEDCQGKKMSPSKQHEKPYQNKSFLDSNQNINSSRFGVIKKNGALPADAPDISQQNDIETSTKLQKSIIDLVPSTVVPIQSTPFKKSSVSNQMNQGTAFNEQKNFQIDEQKIESIGAKTPQLSQSLSQENQGTQINEELKKRSLIQSKTVQRRINERKRSCNHERHSQNTFLRLHSFQKEAQLSQKTNQSKIDSIIEQVPRYLAQWQYLRKSQQKLREPALILKKFCKITNFSCYNQYQQKYEQIMKCPSNSLVEFQIKGEQLTSKFVVKSIQHLFKPNQLKLFPQIFKQIQFSHPTSISQNKHISLAALRRPHSKLVQLVNLILRSNPMMISRIFQDKKYINPHGVYCIWLKDQNGKMQPVFVNDQFAFQEVVDEGIVKTLKPVYSWLGNQNSLWYMVLQKAIAKVLGGYHIISQLSLSQLMNIILASPTVDLGYVDPEKAEKIFTEKIFYNKMISVYSLRENSKLKEGRKIDRIIGFRFNKREPKQSAIHLKVQESTVTFTFSEFLLIYSQSSLLFFNNNYFLNQSPLVIKGTKREVLSCRFSCKNSKNNCYLLFSNFPEKLPTKVSMYKQLNDEEAEITEGMNPLSQQQRRYSYVGEISKTGHFFFEVQINAGNFICLMQNQYERSPFLSIYSEYPIQIQQILSSDLKMQENNQKSKKQDKKKNKCQSKVSERSKISGNSSVTPKVIIERRIIVPEFEDERRKCKKEKEVKKQKQIKIAKQYAYFHDNVQDDQNDSDENKENVLGIESKVERVKKDSKMKKKQLKRIRQKQEEQQKSIPTEKQVKKEGEQICEQKVLAVRSRIVSNYD